jgi:hypothetical protein
VGFQRNDPGTHEHILGLIFCSNSFHPEEIHQIANEGSSRHSGTHFNILLSLSDDFDRVGNYDQNACGKILYAPPSKMIKPGVFLGLFFLSPAPDNIG